MTTDPTESKQQTKDWDYLLAEGSFARKMLENTCAPGGYRINGGWEGNDSRCLKALLLAGLVRSVQQMGMSMVTFNATEAGKAALERTKPPEAVKPVGKSEMMLNILQDAKKRHGMLTVMRRSQANYVCDEMVGIGFLKYEDVTSPDPIFSITDKGLSHLATCELAQKRIETGIERKLDAATQEKIAEQYRTDSETITLPKQDLTSLVCNLGVGLAYARHCLALNQMSMGGQTTEIRKAFDSMIQKDIDRIDQSVKAGKKLVDGG